MRLPSSAQGSLPAAWILERDESLARPEAVRQAEERLLAAIRADDLAHALTLASVLAYMDPHHASARRIKERCAQQLDDTRVRRFPRHDAVLRQGSPWSDLTRRTLSRREALLLWGVDGVSTVEELIATPAMTPLSAFETLDGLVRDAILDVA